MLLISTLLLLFKNRIVQFYIRSVIIIVEINFVYIVELERCLVWWLLLGQLEYNDFLFTH